jgi:hypothetical protein
MTLEEKIQNNQKSKNLNQDQIHTVVTRKTLVPSKGMYRSTYFSLIGFLLQIRIGPIQCKLTAARIKARNYSVRIRIPDHSFYDDKTEETIKFCGSLNSPCTTFCKNGSTYDNPNARDQCCRFGMFIPDGS